MSARRGRRRGSRPDAGGGVRKTDYRQLRTPFDPLPAFSEDRAEDIHQTALRVIEELGIKVLLPEARDLFVQGGALLKGEDMIHIGSEMVEAALATCPRSIRTIGGTPDHNLTLELGTMVFQPGAGCPHATDRINGRRPGRQSDFEDLVRLTDHFDVLHMIPPLVESQDIPAELRHYAFAEAALTLSDKLPFVFARGTPQTEDAMEMLTTFRRISEGDLRAASHCYTIINSNSPRLLDRPMAQGLIDFARWGQVSIVTPFTLMGAMAPITVEGALVLSHAEALAAITLTQLANPGAPVCYGTFTSNVDMKSGAPAFGTPEQFRASLGAGQLARRIGLPWRCAAGSAANLNDVQAANETQMSLWSCVLAGSTIILHSAGWLEGGLTISYEKLVTDVEVLQIIAELAAGQPEDAGALAFEALKEIQPGGHFFGSAHTMERYQAAFYQPLVADYANFGTWTEAGGRDADVRATEIWQKILAEPATRRGSPDARARLRAFIEKRSAEGGAPPES